MAHHLLSNTGLDYEVAKSIFGPKVVGLNLILDGKNIKAIPGPMYSIRFHSTNK